MEDGYLKVGDTGGNWIWTLADANGAVNLTGAEVAFRIVRADAGLTEKTAGSGSTALTDATHGVVTYTFGADDSAFPGRYFCDMQVTFSGGTIATFPRGGNKTLLVEE